MVLKRLYVPERRMTFGGHLEELRQRILRCIASVLITALFCFFFLQDPLISVVLRPHQRASAQRAKYVGFHKLRKANSAALRITESLSKLSPEACTVFVPPIERDRAIVELLKSPLGELVKAARAENEPEVPLNEAAQKLTGLMRKMVRLALVNEAAGSDLLLKAEALSIRFAELMEERGSQLRGLVWKRSPAEQATETLPKLIEALRAASSKGKQALGNRGSPSQAEKAESLVKELRQTLRTYSEAADILSTLKGGKIVAIKYTEQFFTYLKVVFIFALFLSHPYILWQAWQFIGAGLYEHEQKVALQFVPFSLGLFVTGVLFGYFVLIPWGLSYLSSYGDPELVETMLSLSAYLSLFLSLTLLLGVVFQVPLVMFFLARAGLVDPDTFRKVRRYAIFLGFVLGAVLTPPDPFTQLTLAVPLVCLYEIGIYISKIAWRKAARDSAEN